ncbi:RidA family protein [Paraburkholderia sp. RL18-103-BIB-C]|jgi:2-iminobutanoate/2-iminopropanoate deaminase|uniref:RidA family protein n=1 Tax=unclassified Paraburkholderia TaxID=2615204 RepID=UPI0038B92449
MNDSGTRRALRGVNPTDLNPVGHYSSAMIAGDFVFLSGQTPRDANRHVIGDSIEEQTRATLANVEWVLAAAGARLEDVVKVTVYLTDLTLFSRFNALYASWFAEHKPARTTVEAGLQGVLLEIDLVAYIGKR